MRTWLVFCGLALASSVLPVVAQRVGDGVILTGGVGPATATGAPMQNANTVVYQTPTVVCPPPVLAVPAYTALNGGYYNPNVIYFGGPNSCYRNYYSGCRYSPNVLYFGRGQAYYQGYQFTACR